MAVIETPLKSWEKDEEKARRSGAYHAALDLLDDGVYPTPTVLLRALGRRGYGPMNVHDNAGRRAAFRDRGWHQPKPGARWVKGA